MQWIKLVKTNHDVYVRVAEKVDLQGLPRECNLMAVSNARDLLVVGGNTGRSRKIPHLRLARNPL